MRVSDIFGIRDWQLKFPKISELYYAIRVPPIDFTYTTIALSPSLQPHMYLHI